jgi:HAD superfamily hydrolase (TIGR01457 family)
MQRYRAFLVDLDGVLVRGSAPLPGAPEALSKLQKLGRVVVFSNNSTRSRRAFAERLQALGFEITPEMIVSSAFIAVRYLLERSGPSSVYAIGEEGLREELTAAGHELVSPEGADFVVAGLDRGFRYEQLTEALQALLRGATFIAANADPVYPTAEGLIPGAGAIVGAIRGMGYPPAEIVGKPSPIAFRVAMETAGVKNAKECLVIGDRLDTDIEGAVRAGIDSVLVFTGVTRPEDLIHSETQPTFTAESFAALVP